MIKIEGLHKKFGQNVVLRNLDLEISDKGIFAILGPNGSGKTTLIKCLLGLCIPDKGQISIGGKNIIHKSQYRKDLLYLPQIANFPGNLRVQELIRMIKDLRGVKSQEKELIEAFGLQSTLKKKLSTLSGGTKQKVNIVLSFMFEGQYIILDEPTTGLDPAALITLKELIQQEKQKGKTILVTSHIMQFVEEMADELVYLLEGDIYFRGSLQDLKLQTEEPDFEHAIASIAKIPAQG